MCYYLQLFCSMVNIKLENRQSAGKIIGEISRAAHVFFQYKFKDCSIGHAQVRTLHFLCIYFFSNVF